jgi:hypothetical protein
MMRINYIQHSHVQSVEESHKEKMPMNSCQYYCRCTHCGAILKPKAGNCCVYCSYGDIPCPSVQNEQGFCELYDSNGRERI